MTAKHKDDTAPATKADIEAIMDSISKLYDANEKWKEEIKRHFDVTAEKVTAEFKGAFKDRTEQHDDAIADLRKRVVRVEHHLGLIAAS